MKVRVEFGFGYLLYTTLLLASSSSKRSCALIASSYGASQIENTTQWR